MCSKWTREKINKKYLQMIMSKKGCCQYLIEITPSNLKLIKTLLKFKIKLLINFKIMINGIMKEDILLENTIIYDYTI